MIRRTAIALALAALVAGCRQEEQKSTVPPLTIPTDKGPVVVQTAPPPPQTTDFWFWMWLMSGSNTRHTTTNYYHTPSMPRGSPPMPRALYQAPSPPPPSILRPAATISPPSPMPRPTSVPSVGSTVSRGGFGSVGGARGGSSSGG